jgi:hypothetical protein
MTKRKTDDTQKGAHLAVKSVVAKVIRDSVRDALDGLLEDLGPVSNTGDQEALWAWIDERLDEQLGYLAVGLSFDNGTVSVVLDAGKGNATRTVPLDLEDIPDLMIGGDLEELPVIDRLIEALELRKKRIEERGP